MRIEGLQKAYEESGNRLSDNSKAFYKMALNAYQREVNLINIAAGIQSEIEQLQAEGRDTSVLEARREEILKEARDSFQDAVYLEHLARHGEEPQE